MKSIQTRGGSYKHLSIFLAMMVLGALFLSVAPVMAGYSGNQNHNSGGNGNCNSGGHGNCVPPVVCPAVSCSKQLVTDITYTTQYKTTNVKKKVCGHTINVKVTMARDCKITTTSQNCWNNALCGNTGCAAVPGSDFTNTYSIKTTCNNRWYLV